MYYMLYPSPVGELRLIANGNALTQLWLPNEVARRTDHTQWLEKADHPVLDLIRHRLDDYFAGKSVRFDDLPLAPQGTVFQRAVWQQLNQIGYGQISSYGQIASGINNPKAVRAVGGAVGANPIAILLPCHRVLGKNHSLTGFSGGLAVKRALLAIENIPYYENNSANTSRLTPAQQD